MTDLISIIVPIYNKEKYLKKCIDSIIEQSYSNIEIILIDDGSTDNSPKLCDEYSARDSRISVVHNQNKGVSSARNSGIDMANGRYLMFVDADDWVASDFCESAHKAITENNSDIAVFGLYYVNEKDYEIKDFKKYENELIDNLEALQRLLTEEIRNYLCNKIFKASLFSHIRFVEGRIWEDLEIMYRLFLASKSVALCDKCTYFYLKNSDSITSNISAKALEDIFSSRYERNVELCERGYENIAEKGMKDLLLSSLRLYDRSLKENIHPEILGKATAFLNENKALAINCGIKFKLYFKAKFLYDLIIRCRQALGKLYRIIENRR